MSAYSHSNCPSGLEAWWFWRFCIYPSWREQTQASQVSPYWLSRIYNSCSDNRWFLACAWYWRTEASVDTSSRMDHLRCCMWFRHTFRADWGLCGSGTYISIASDRPSGRYNGLFRNGTSGSRPICCIAHYVEEPLSRMWYTRIAYFLSGHVYGSTILSSHGSGFSDQRWCPSCTGCLW